MLCIVYIANAVNVQSKNRLREIVARSKKKKTKFYISEHNNGRDYSGIVQEKENKASKNKEKNHKYIIRKKNKESSVQCAQWFSVSSHGYLRFDEITILLRLLATRGFSQDKFGQSVPWKSVYIFFSLKTRSVDVFVRFVRTEIAKTVVPFCSLYFFSLLFHNLSSKYCMFQSLAYRARLLTPFTFELILRELRSLDYIKIPALISYTRYAFEKLSIRLYTVSRYHKKCSRVIVSKIFRILRTKSLNILIQSAETKNSCSKIFRVHARERSCS